MFLCKLRRSKNKHETVPRAHREAHRVEERNHVATDVELENLFSYTVLDLFIKVLFQDTVVHVTLVNDH